MITSFTMRSLVAISLGLVAVSPLSAQNTARGHWTGAVDSPGGQVTMELDLEQTLGGWIGAIAIPGQGSLPLEGITFKDGKTGFRIRINPTADPAFTGTLSPDGQYLTGELSQGTSLVPMKFMRTGEAKVPKMSPAVAAEFLGTWEGTIDVGAPMRVALAITNAPMGAEAVLTSVDQGGAQIPVNTITQRGTKLRVTITSVGGGYEGDISTDGKQLVGNWTQGGSSIPLTFKKAGK